MKTRRLPRLVGSMLALTAVAAIAATPSSANLPRTYGVQRVDSGTPAANGKFGMTIVNVGDVNGDGDADLLTGTDKHGTGAGTNQVVVISGKNGSILRTYAVPNPDLNAAGGDRPTGFGNSVTKLGDVGRCNVSPGAGIPCPAGQYSATPDGIGEHVVAASGVDVDDQAGDDLGAVYVFDGATGALLERFQMPQADRDEQRITFSNNDPRFGRTVLSPGDIVGDAKPDLLVGATDFSETKADASPISQCGLQAGSANCAGAGRVYVYSGADIDGDPATIVATPAQTIKSPLSQPDDNGAYPPGPFNAAEGFGILLIPVGAAGRCPVANVPAVVAGDCTAGNSQKNDTSAATGDPTPTDFAIVANGYDILGMNEVGRVIELDGKTLSVLKGTDYPDPRPEASWGQAQNGMVYPALGDLGGGSTHPDFVVPDIQWSGTHEAEGRVLTVNGQPGSAGSFRELPSRFMDSTPQSGEQFGLSTTTLGDVTGDPYGELLIGAIGPHNPANNLNVVNDVHIINPITDVSLQSIQAPDAQGGETFGTGTAPLGDVNGDGFQDFAVSAGFYDLVDAARSCTPCTNAGRVYIFRSDNSPAPSPPVAPAGPAGPAATAVVLAGRTLELEASKSRIRRGARVRLEGLLEAFANERSCEAGQSVALQRRRPGRLASSARYRTFKRVKTNAAGEFTTRTRPRRTYVYRALVTRTSECTGAASPRERVTVVKRRKRR